MDNKKSDSLIGRNSTTHGGFRHYHLDTVADWGWRTFLWEGLFREGAEEGQGHVHIVNVKTKKRKQKRRITKTAVTPTYNAFRHSDSDTVASLVRRIFLCEVVAQGQDQGHAHAYKKRQ